MQNYINIWFRSLLTLISPELNTRYCYWRRFGKKLNLKNPQTSNEKALWLKLNTYLNNPLVTQCADKYAVRDYVKQCGCEEILNPLIGVYDKPEEIDFNSLPKKFAIKYNYYYSYNIICKDKSKFDTKAAIKEMHRWSRSRMHLFASEMQYSGIKRKFLCEQYIETKDGMAPSDYKIYCCNGEPIYVMVCIGRAKNQKPKFYYLNRKGELQCELTRDGLAAPEDFKFDIPLGWGEMFEYAQKLCKPFPYVRTDFYLESGKVIFGELTFTPGAGLDNNKLPQTDNIIGNLIHLPEK